MQNSARSRLFGLAEQRVAWPTQAIACELPAEPVMVVADADRIGQVVTNYLANGLKYSAPGQPITVVLGEEDGVARVLVHDHGHGLSAAQQTHIWEHFHRVPGIKQQTGTGVGLGLGLYICRTLIEQHGGQVGVSSAAGQGSTFWFTRPIAASG